MKNERIIIDTDPGVDDALAITFAIMQGLPVDALVTVYGNATIEDCSRNALTILEIVDSDLPVYQGSDRPMAGNNCLANAHGKGGLGGVSVETDKKISEKPALQYYKEVLSDSQQEDITIVAIGPTTNIGQFVAAEPALFQKASKIIIMGGVFGEPGNVTPSAEFNVYNDPQALSLILSSGHPNIVVVPADVCRKVTFDADVFSQINNPTLQARLTQIADMYIRYYMKDAEYGGFTGGVMYDLLAVALLADESLFESEVARVSVVTDNTDVRYGLTEKVSGDPNCSVVTSVNADGVTKLFLETMNKESKKKETHDRTN